MRFLVWYQRGTADSNGVYADPRTWTIFVLKKNFNLVRASTWIRVRGPLVYTCSTSKKKWRQKNIPLHNAAIHLIVFNNGHNLEG